MEFQIQELFEGFAWFVIMLGQLNNGEDLSKTCLPQKVILLV